MCRHCFTAESMQWLRVTLVAVVATIAIMPVGAHCNLQQTRSDMRTVESADDMLLDFDCHVYVSASSPLDDDDRPALLPICSSTFALLALLPYTPAVQVAALAFLGTIATLQSQAVRWQI